MPQDQRRRTYRTCHPAEGTPIDWPYSKVLIHLSACKGPGHALQRPKWRSVIPRGSTKIPGPLRFCGWKLEETTAYWLFLFFFPDVNQFVPNTHLMVCQWSWRSEKRLPVMIAGSIQLPGLSQFRLSVVAVLDVGTLWLALEGEEALGSPPKLMLMFGRSALSPSCHSFIFKLSTELLLSGRFTNKKKMKDKKIKSWS